MLKRLFCFGPDPRAQDADREWQVSRTTFLQTQSLYSKARILDVLEDELEERFNAVEGRKVVLEAPSMRRLHRANLPQEDSQRAGELIGKLTAIDRSRIELVKECARLSRLAEAAQRSQRDAEFGKAKAEALATARGQALMRSQHAAREAEAQQIQLSEMLRTALGHLGMSITPPRSCETSQEVPGVEYQAQVASEGDATSLPDRAPGPLFASPAAREAPGSASSCRRTPPTGFTVYSNELSDSPGPSPQPLEPEDSSASATKWRDISTVAALSPGSTAATPPMLNVEEHAHRLAQMIIPHLDPLQIESLVHIGSSMGSPSAMTPGTRKKVLQHLRPEDSAAPQEESRTLNPNSSNRVASAVEGQGKNLRKQQPQQPVGWTSPSRQPAQAHAHARAQTVLKDASDFYAPFGHGMQENRVEDHNDARRQTVMGPPPPRAPPIRAPAVERAPRRSTFSMADSSKIRSKSQVSQDASTYDSSRDTLIKAVGQQPTQNDENVRNLQLQAAVGAIPEDDRFARQRRAAERLVKKLNSKLPPEYQRADPLGLVERGTPGSGGRGPKGSLRRREAAMGGYE